MLMGVRICMSRCASRRGCHHNCDVPIALFMSHGAVLLLGWVHAATARATRITTHHVAASTP